VSDAARQPAHATRHAAPVTFYSIAALVRHAESMLADVDVVSFDVFDTLLVRRVHDPDMLKVPVARFIAAKAAQRGLAWPPDKVMRFRNKVEAMHRRRAGRSFPDREACYPQFMADVLTRIFGDAGLLGEVTDFELGVENAMLVARSGLTGFLRRLRAAGKRILGISDMYLPAGHLQRLINHAGLALLLDEVISSADTTVAKASGAAWPMIRERFGLDPDRWLHIGDNPHADGKTPSDFRIRALLLRDAGELLRKGIVRRHIGYAARHPYWKGRAVQQVMLPLESEDTPRDPLYVAGYNFMGPLVGAFITHVAERCREQGIRRIYFFSREGWTFLRAWEGMAPWLFPAGDAPDARYLHVSRIALANAACGRLELTREMVDIAFQSTKNRDLRDLCRIYGLDLAAVSALAAHHGLRDDTPLSRYHAGWIPANRERLDDLLDDAAFADEVKRQTVAANDALVRYLETEQFFAQDRVALVDIGWIGTMQHFLHRALEHRADRPAMEGFLFALRGRQQSTVNDRNRAEGFLFDYRQWSFRGSLLLNAVDIFEDCMRAPCPGLVRYVKDGDGFSLAFRDGSDDVARSEQRQSDYFQPLREGMLDAAGRFGAAMAVLGYRAGDLLPWLHRLLVARLAFPEAGEVALLRQAGHLDDFAGPHQPLAQTPGARPDLWELPLWKLRFVPFIRTFFYVRQAVAMPKK